MALRKELYLLSLVVPMTLATGSNDTVNERFSVSTTEMEAHWQVDCTASWNTLFEAAATFKGGEGCEIPIDLPAQLKLCGFIYQPPGNDYTPACPDYQGASQAAGQGDCQAMGLLLEESRTCSD